MELQYLTVYLEVLLLCFIFLAVMLFNVSRDLGSEWEVVTFKWMIRALLIALVVDGFTHAHYRNAIELPRTLLAFFYSTYMAIMSGVMPFAWLVFAELHIKPSFIQNRKTFYLSLVPVLIAVIAAYASMKTGWYYTIDENLVYHRGPYWATQNIVAYSYFVITTISALSAISKTSSLARRKDLIVIASFAIAPFGGAILQLFIGGHPFIAPSITIAIFFIFIKLQGNMINHDALTGIYNRKMADRYLNELLHRVNFMNFYVFIIDIDSFKMINDNYGHIIGDDCLKLTAETLRSIADEHHGFTSRYGGDEFICIIDEQYLDKPEYFIERCNDVLAIRCKTNKLPSIIHCSFGYAKCTNSSTKATTLIAEADRMLYTNKKSI